MTIQTGVYRLGRDAELRRTSSGEAVASLSLAYNYGKKDSAGKYPTQWVDASLWGKRAEALTEHLTVGKELWCVLDDVHIETYQKRDGGEGSKLVARVTDIKFVGSSGGERAAAPRPAPAAAPRPAAKAAPKGDDDAWGDSDPPF